MGLWHQGDALVGNAYFLRGRHREAIPFLRRQVASCAFFTSPVLAVRAAEQLGEALEATGDPAGACDAFARVLARWGSAKPKSITADRARAHVKALKCPR